MTEEAFYILIFGILLGLPIGAAIAIIVKKIEEI